MTPLHEQEIEDAREKVTASGGNADDFRFDVAFMEPDPDGGGMYTVRYEITATNGATGKSGGYMGGIGLEWVSVFEEELAEGKYG
ncbi:MAG: hypothetical protein EON93_14555 [Burkholderiales bacterium]|nr:MAG: hypothetical protein EON93_14555 [Burkholderiales bacterium]